MSTSDTDTVKGIVGPLWGRVLGGWAPAVGFELCLVVWRTRPSRCQPVQCSSSPSQSSVTRHCATCAVLHGHMASTAGSSAYKLIQATAVSLIARSQVLLEKSPKQISVHVSIYHISWHSGIGQEEQKQWKQPRLVSMHRGMVRFKSFLDEIARPRQM